jgi:hypothetical protein
VAGTIVSGGGEADRPWQRAGAVCGRPVGAAGLSVPGSSAERATVYHTDRIGAGVLV